MEDIITAWNTLYAPAPRLLPRICDSSPIRTVKSDDSLVQISWKWNLRGPGSSCLCHIAPFLHLVHFKSKQQMCLDLLVEAFPWGTILNRVLCFIPVGCSRFSLASLWGWSSRMPSVGSFAFWSPVGFLLWQVLAGRRQESQKRGKLVFCLHKSSVLADASVR